MGGLNEKGPKEDKIRGSSIDHQTVLGDGGMEDHYYLDVQVEGEIERRRYLISEGEFGKLVDLDKKGDFDGKDQKIKEIMRGKIFHHGV